MVLQLNGHPRSAVRHSSTLTSTLSREHKARTLIWQASHRVCVVMLAMGLQRDKGEPPPRTRSLLACAIARDRELTPRFRVGYL